MPLFSKVKDIFKSSSSVKRKKVYHNVRLQNPEEVWTIRGEIGDGAYGKVYKAENISNGTLAALKKVILEEDEDLDNFMVEIDILAECQHPNIVRLLEAYHWDGCLWMYLEFCDGGAVDSIMVDLDRPLAEEQIAYITHHLLKALDYVHNHKVIHRDIKAGNVLLTTDGGVKLADFGVSAKNKNTMDKRGTFIGTPYWLAPEVIKCETFIDSKYDYKADIWSLGITLIEFAQMDPPNHEVSPLRVLLKIQKADPPKLECPSKFSKEFNDFIAACLVKNPEDRPDAQQLLSHPFVSSPQNAKHIVALLIEYQAEVVEEDVEEDPRASRLSLESVDQSSASQDISVSSADLPGSRQHKEVTPTGVMERRAAKGPAPPPPVAPAPKKGPAPSTPSTPVSVPSTFPATTSVSSSTQITSTSSTVSSAGSTVPSSVPSTVVAATSISSTDSTTSPVKSTSSIPPPVPAASVAPSVTSPSSVTDTSASVSSVPVASVVSPVAPSVSSSSVSSSNAVSGTSVSAPISSTLLPPSSTVESSSVHSTSPASVPSPAAYIATVTSSSVTILPAADKPSSATQLSGKEDNLVVTDSVPASDVPSISGISAIETTLPSSAVQSIATTAVSVFSGVVLSSNVPESNSSTTISPPPVVSSSGVSVTVPEGLPDTSSSSQSVALPLSVMSDSVCVAPVAGAVVDTSTVTPDMSMVSVTTLGDDYILDKTSASLPEEKLLIEEKEDDLMPIHAPQPQASVIDSTSKTQITRSGSLTSNDGPQGDSFQASTTVVSIGDPVPALSMSDVVTTNFVPGEISSEVDVCGSIDDALEESLSSIDQVLVDEPDEPSLVMPVSRKSAEARQRLPDELDAPLTEPSISSSPDSFPMVHPTAIALSPQPPAPEIAAAAVSPQPAPEIAAAVQLPSDYQVDPPAQIIASIGSEGTVIVRTPTPTPSSPSPTASTPTPTSLVTFSGPGVVESPPPTPVDSPRSPMQDENFSRAAEEAVQFLDDAIGHHTSAAHDSLTSTESSANNSVVVVDGGHPQNELIISHYNTLAGESNTDDIGTPGRGVKATDVTDKSAHISVVPISQKLPASDSQHLTIEGTTLEDTDVDSLVSPVKAPEDARRPADLPNGRDSAAAVVALRHAAHEDRSDSDSVSTVSSEKENSKPGGGSSEEEVVLRHSAAARSPHSDTTSYRSIAGESVLSEDSSLRPIDRNRQNRQANLRNGRTKEENESIALRKKTRKRTRKFMIDGVVMTTTTSKVIYGDDEDGNYMSSGHLARKQELRELKILQKLEQKQFQELGVKANAARLEQERKFESEKTQLVRTYDNDVDTLNRHQKQQVERTEGQHEVELKSASKKIRADQEKELRSFRESLKQELKLLKQEVDLLPKDVRKEALRTRREQLESDQAEREKAFLERLHQNHEASMKRLSEEHRADVALLERQFLQKKHQLLRAREAALWELEERHLHERHQLAKRQLKDIFFLQRHQMLLRHEKELEQVRRQNVQREDELMKKQAVERRAMPKRIRQEMKARELMFRESMRISTSNLPDSHHDEKERLRKFQECERRRYEAERKRAEQKHKRQLEELQASTEAHAKELEQMQNEKRKMLMEHETLKLKAQEEEYQKELKEWKNNLKPRKQKLEDEFEQQLMEQEQFYGAYLTTNGTTLLQSAADAPNTSAY